jgi:thiamine-phosphate pyrophosphorylase
MKDKLDLSLYLVTDKDLMLGRNFLDIIDKAVQGGVTAVQLREKNRTTLEFYELSRTVKKFLGTKGIPLIINDRLDIAQAVGAEGIHIGQSDMPWRVVRHIMGEQFIIGLSVESVDQARQANKADIDYIGLSPVFTTPTKTDVKTQLGLEGVSEIAELTKHKTVAIGGINKSNAQKVVKAGVDGIAVVSAICSTDYPEKAARELLNIVKTNR